MSSRINPDQCIACSTCVVHCPVAEATPNFPGPRLTGPAMQRFRLLGLADDATLDYCANCKNCDISCPQGVSVSAMNMLARAEQTAHAPFSLRNWLLAHGELEAGLLRPLPAWLKNTGMNNALTRAVLHKLGIHRQAPLPPFAPKPFRSLLRGLAQPSAREKVIFFPGCFVNIYDPDCGLDMVWLLNRAGFAVEVPEAFGCCGLPMMANGFMADARRQAVRNLAEAARCRGQGLTIVTGCPSCALMLNADLGEYFPDLLAQYGPPQVEDAQAFLLRQVEAGRLDLGNGQGETGHLIYHAPCHLRAQGAGLPGLELLRRTPGLAVDEANAGCCGISGSYGFKKEKYAIAQSVGAELFRTVRESGAQAAVSECGTCRVQIRHGSGLPSLHPASVLRRHLEQAGG